MRSNAMHIGLRSERRRLKEQQDSLSRVLVCVGLAANVVDDVVTERHAAEDTGRPR